MSLSSDQFETLKKEIQKRCYPFVENHSNSFVIIQSASSTGFTFSLYGGLFVYPIHFSRHDEIEGLPTIDEITEALVGQEKVIRAAKAHELHAVECTHSSAVSQ